MALQIKKAVRELVYPKIALMGASGSGKTYSALVIATGMAKALKPILGREARIIMLNNEASRGLYYANEFTYDISDILAPHNPEKYVEAIYDCVKAEYDILILDSSSHEWEGDGGCLAIQQLAGGRYTDWGKVTPRHNKFIQAIADSPIALIATMRGKDQYEITPAEGNQKAGVQKIGVGGKQREGFEYEFTASFLIEQQDNHAKAQKDNTHLFENKGRFLFKEQDGEDIIAWANSGEGYTPTVRNAPAEEPKKTTMDLIIGLCTELGGQKDEELMALVKKYAPKGNPKVIKESSQQDALLGELEAMKVARGEK